MKAMLDGKPAPRMPTVRNPAYVLRGVLKCGRYGTTLLPASTQKGGRTYRYYRCLTRDKQGASACGAPQLPARAIEDLVVGYIKRFASTPGAVEEVERLVSQRVDVAIAGRLPERKRLVDQIARMAARERNLSDEIEAAAGRAPHAREALVNRLDQAVQCLRESQQQLSTLETEVLALDDARSEVEWVRRILTDFERMWQVATPDTQARIIRALADSIEVDDRTGEVKVHLIAVSAPPAHQPEAHP